MSETQAPVQVRVHPNQRTVPPPPSPFQLIGFVVVGMFLALISAEIGFAIVLGGYVYWRYAKWKHLKLHHPEIAREANRIGLLPLLLYLSGAGIALGGTLNNLYGKEDSLLYVWFSLGLIAIALLVDQHAKFRDRQRQWLKTYRRSPQP